MSTETMANKYRESVKNMYDSVLAELESKLMEMVETQSDCKNVFDLTVKKDTSCELEYLYQYESHIQKLIEEALVKKGIIINYGNSRYNSVNTEDDVQLQLKSCLVNILESRICGNGLLSIELTFRIE